MLTPWNVATSWRLDGRWFWARQWERLQMAIAWMLPRWLVYWASIRLMAHATTGKHGTTEVPSLTVLDALNRWEK